MSDPPRAPVRLAASLEGPPDAPFLVLGNSLGTTRAVWDPQVPALRAHFRLLRYEHRGHGSGGDSGGRDPGRGGDPGGGGGDPGGSGPGGSGPGGSGPGDGGPGGGDPGGGDPGRSPAPAGPYAIDELGRDVLALLDDHGIERSLYCGISLGGMVGMWLAANAPERIAALGLCCTSAYLPPAAGWVARAAQVRAGGMRAIVDQSAERWFTEAFRTAEQQTVRAFASSLEGLAPEGYAGCCEAIAGMDLRAALALIAVPTLVIAGAEDPATPPWHAAVIASGIRNCRLKVIRGASHLANVSAAGQVTAVLLSHLLSACG